MPLVSTMPRDTSRTARRVDALFHDRDGNRQRFDFAQNGFSHWTPRLDQSTGQRDGGWLIPWAEPVVQRGDVHRDLGGGVFNGILCRERSALRGVEYNGGEGCDIAFTGTRRPPHQPLLALHAGARENGGHEAAIFPAPIEFAQRQHQRDTTEREGTALVADEMAPATGAHAAAIRRAPPGAGSRARDDHDAGMRAERIVHGRLEVADHVDLFGDAQTRQRALDADTLRLAPCAGERATEHGRKLRNPCIRERMRGQVRERVRTRLGLEDIDTPRITVQARELLAGLVDDDCRGACAAAVDAYEIAFTHTVRWELRFLPRRHGGTEADTESAASTPLRAKL